MLLQRGKNSAHTFKVATRQKRCAHAHYSLSPINQSGISNLITGATVSSTCRFFFLPKKRKKKNACFTKI
jgi:hypothetical protein